MFRHVSLFRWVDTMTPDQVDAAAAALRELPGLIPALRAYAVGPDAGVDDGNWDFAVTADFDDEDGYRTYATHAEHVRVATTYIRPFLAARAAVQFRM